MRTKGSFGERGSGVVSWMGAERYHGRRTSGGSEASVHVMSDEEARELGMPYAECEMRNGKVYVNVMAGRRVLTLCIICTPRGGTRIVGAFSFSSTVEGMTPLSPHSTDKDHHHA